VPDERETGASDRAGRMPCPLCGQTAIHTRADAETLLVRCPWCRTFTIDEQLAASFQEARLTADTSTLEELERLRRAAADAWNRGGRLSIGARNWRELGLG